MSFPRYPKYKPSGVEWLGEVPEHWGLPKLKSVATFSGGGTPSRDDPRYWNGDIPWVSPKDMKAERIEGAEESITEEGLRNSASNLLQAGRVLIVVRSGILKHTIPIAINETAVALNQDMKALSFDATKCAARFFLRWVQGHNDQLLFAWAKQGATVESIEHSYLAQTVVPLPDLAEQKAIAEFLDRETGKIDELVAEQRRLMELLKEKRQAVISHAVTKGLNPHAPMKPSGIEWLGEVPEHWEMRRVSHLFRAAKGKNGQLLTKEFCGSNSGDYPVYSGQTENNGLMGTWDQFEFDFGQDGVLFSTTVGSGKVMTLKHLFGKFSLSQNCMVIWPTSSLCLTRFYFYHFQPLFDVERALIPQHMQASFRMEDLYSYIIAVPPIDEQRSVVAFLETKLLKFDTLTAEAQRAIDFLQERRTALISAAVTGEIDVRPPPKN